MLPKSFARAVYSYRADSRFRRPAAESRRRGRGGAGTDFEQPGDGQHVENAVEDVGREQVTPQC